MEKKKTNYKKVMVLFNLNKPAQKELAEWLAEYCDAEELAAGAAARKMIKAYREEKKKTY